MLNIAINTSSFGQLSKKPIDILNEHGYNLIFNETGQKLNEKENIELISNCDGVIAGTEIYNQYVFKHASNLKIISRLGVGLDNIDLEYAKNSNIHIVKTKTTPAGL